MCLCSIEIDGAWEFYERSACKLQPGRSAGLLDLRNKKPMALGGDRFWWIGGLWSNRWRSTSDLERRLFGVV